MCLIQFNSEKNGVVETMVVSLVFLLFNLLQGKSKKNILCSTISCTKKSRHNASSNPQVLPIPFTTDSHLQEDWRLQTLQENTSNNFPKNRPGQEPPSRTPFGYTTNREKKTHMGARCGARPTKPYNSGSSTATHLAN